MYKSLLAVTSALLLAACQSTVPTQEVSAEQAPTLGMANPASVHCVELGGKLEIKDSANGQTGYCHLPDGKVVEEWALFRESQKQCNQNLAQKLKGQKNLTDQNILDATQSRTVRQVGLNDAVTMDYRSDRITVVVDSNGKIVRANCG